jgi:excisionase family DNA binding protein
MPFDKDYPLLLTIQQAARKTGKSEKTIRRAILAGKLAASNQGGGYLIRREDLAAYCPEVHPDWRVQGELSNHDLRLTVMEGIVDELRSQVEEMERQIAALQLQVKKLLPRKAPTRERASGGTGRRRSSRSSLEDG